MKYTIVSADNHIVEPRDLFTKRLPAKFQDRAPRVVPHTDGGDGWSWNGKPPPKSFGIEAVAGQGGKNGHKGHGLKWEEIMPGNYDGAAHLKDMDKDSTDACVLFPQVATNAYGDSDREFSQAIMAAYNDWMLEDFVSADPRRLIGLCLLPVDDGADVAIAEMERCVKKGAKAFFLPGVPVRPYHDAYYDPLWKAASNARVPLSAHRNFGGQKAETRFANFFTPGVNVAGMVVRYFAGIDSLTNMIFTGAFERHPNLKIVWAEVNCGWIPFWRFTMDQAFEQQKDWAKIPLTRSPSEFLGKNVFVTTLNDEPGFAAMRTDSQLASTAMFSTDYPHSVTLWPNSRKYIAELTQGYDEATRHKILAGNAVGVFNLA